MMYIPYIKYKTSISKKTCVGGFGVSWPIHQNFYTLTFCTLISFCESSIASIIIKITSLIVLECPFTLLTELVHY